MRSFLRRVTAVERPHVVGPITLSHGINEFFAIVIPPIIPLLVTDLGITYAQAGFLLTVFFLMYSLFQLPAGVVADRFGKRRLMIAGLGGMTLGIVMAALAPHYEGLLVAQAIAGISGSTFHPAGLSIISDVETPRTSGKAMGVFAFGGTLGTLAAPLFVGGIAIIVGWRGALLSAAILGGGMTLVVIALALRGTTGSKSTLRPDGGITVESWGDRIRTAFGILATKEVAVLTVLTLVMSMQHRAIQTFTTSFVATDLEGSVSVGNVVFFTLLAGGAVASLWAGELADRVNRITLGVGAALTTAVLVGATVLIRPISSGLPFAIVVGILLVWFVLIGFVMYANYPVKNALIAGEADTAYSGSLFGVIQTGSSLGSASGPVIFGAIATEFGLLAAFPAIAGVGVLLAVLFALLWII